EEDEAASAVAEEQQGPALRAAAAQGAGQMSAERTRQNEAEQQERTRANTDVAAAEQENAAAANTERAEVRSEAQAQRSQWRSQQRGMVGAARAEATQVAGEARTTVTQERRRADTEAAEHHRRGEEESATARREGEGEASRHREEGRQESGGGGFFGWLASRARALFDRVRQGVTAAFERARQAVRSAVDRARQAASAVMARARDAVVGAIKRAAGAIAAIGDRLIPGFAELRQRFQRAIRERIERAWAALNRFADRLKAGIRAVMNTLGRALSAIGSALAAGLRSVVNGVVSAVRGAINAAKAALQALGAFMAVAKDVAGNPMAWLRNLGAAVMDGIRNHLWQALRTAISNWFNEKVEQVLGLGRMVWNLLTRGGIALGQVAQMAWEGIKSAIPPALIAILVEKLVSMIVPAAGAVLAIIQGLQAAWGTVSRILQAIDRFVTFLKAVKSGSAGAQFAATIAAAAVAVIDFVSNWLLARLARGASRVAGRIRALAQRLGQRLGGALRRAGRRLRGIGRRTIRRPRRSPRRRSRRSRRQQETASDRRRRLQERLDRAIREIRPRLDSLLARGVSGIRLRIQLALWRMRYRLSALSVDGDADVRIVARVNPAAPVKRGFRPRGQRLRQLMHTVASDLLNHPDVATAAANVRVGSRKDSKGRTTTTRRIGAGSAGFPAAIRHLRRTNAPIPRGDMARWRVGRQEVRERRANPYAPPHDLEVGMASAYTPRRSGGQSAGRILEDIGRRRAWSRQRTAEVMRELVTTGRMPRGVGGADANRLAAVTFLMFGRESARNPANLVFAPMTLDLVERSNVSWRTALNRRGSLRQGGDPSRSGGIFPMSFRGASRAAADIEAGGIPSSLTDPKERSRRERNMRILVRREIALSERWLNRTMRAEGLRFFANAQHARQWIFDHMLAFYRIRRRNSPTTP
ncbi:MAG: phage tail protein, partial [Gaiellales bacterium]